MEVLSEKLSKILSLSTGNSILKPEQILVQSPGMSTWLRIEIAEHNGIAAAQEFPLPSSFIWQLCYLLLDDVPKTNPFTKSAMTWKLMSLLPQIINEEVFSPLRHYLGFEIEIKLFQLCGRIADIFDQYLVYRPDWILGWENNENPITLTEDQQWQPKLWRKLIEYNDVELDQSHYHRANLHQALINALSSPELNINKLPTQLFVFGISSMAPQTLDVLYQLANKIDVFMFSLSPCQHYWGDIVDPKSRARMSLAYENKKKLPELWQESLDVGNPILANNGKMGREMLDMVLDLPATHIGFSEFYHMSDHQTLLSGIQNDILEMETLGQSLSPELDQYLNIQQKRCLNAADDSIALRSCHSPLREVETLHDHLLQKLQQNPELEPKDIVIMLPDVAAYAPFIDAVFSSKQGNHYIPYAIADRGAAQESPLINSFLNLLSLDKSRFGFSEIISILEVPAVMARFSLIDDEMILLKQWIKRAGIRWGRNASSRKEQGLAEFDKNSWAFGIRRMLLGYALGDEAEIYRYDLPSSGIDGQSAQSLGKLLNFLETLDNIRQNLLLDVPPAEKIAFLISILDSMYLSDDDVRNDVNQLRNSIELFSQEIEETGYNGSLPLQLLRQWFKTKLTESRVGQRYLAGSVNFCTLMPMRSIPFKVICLLGMNDGIYPRVQHPIGFDLMAHFDPRRGDRSRRTDDRYLFLEALLSAREQLYISYIGHSERDNSERIASMLVSELLEYCQLCYFPESITSEIAEIEHEATLDNDTLAHLGEKSAKCLAKQLLIQMPLQPFDEKLYRDNQENLPRSYADNWCPPNQVEDLKQRALFIKPEDIIANTEFEQNVDDGKATKVTEIALSSLIRFYRNPAQYFIQRSLKADLSIQMDETDDDEPFTLSTLSRHQIQSDMINSSLKLNQSEVSEGLLNELKATGELPMSPFDDITLNKYEKDIASVIDRGLYLRGESEGDTINISLSFMLKTKVELQGRIDDIYAKGLVNVRPGTAKAKDFIALYIRHLCLNASGYHKPSYLLDAANFYTLAELDPYEACDLLLNLLSHFESGLSHPFMFMPETSLAYYLAEGNHQMKLLKAEEKWTNDNGFGDGDDPYNNRLYFFPDDFNEDKFGNYAHQIFKSFNSIFHSAKLKELQNYVENQASNSTEINKGDK